MSSQTRSKTSTPTETTAPQNLGELIALDPRELTIHPGNDRDPGDIQDLAASIAGLGVLLPLLLDGNRQVIAGKRRRLAAIEAGLNTVPCIVRPDLTVEDSDQIAQAEQVMRMLGENTHRRGLSLDPWAHWLGGLGL